MRKKTILIAGKPFTYDDESEDITYDSLTPISEEDAKNLLALTKKLFDQCGLRFYLFYGTLLGAVRDNGIIKGDEDVDVYVDSEEQLRNIIPFLYDNGLKLCRIEEHLLYSFHSDNKSFIDVYIKDKLPPSIWSLWCDSISGYAVPKRYIKKHDVINFLGMELLCPHKPERLLEYWYGKTWKVPISGHDYTYELPSRYWWLTKGKGMFETYKFIIMYPIKHPLSAIKKIFKKLFVL